MYCSQTYYKDIIMLWIRIRLGSYKFRVSIVDYSTFHTQYRIEYTVHCLPSI